MTTQENADPNRRTRSPILWWRRFALAALFLCVELGFTGCQAAAQNAATGAKTWTAATAETPLYPVTIVQPASVGGLDTADKDLTGSAVTIGCPTCHEAGADSDVGPLTQAAGLGKAFHYQVQLQHGALRCESCHTRERPHRLHDSAGDEFVLSDAMRLCSQCHGPQRRNYDHGAHGGMRGYWDRQRGPRTRNSCVTCHHPHNPQYPKVQPVPGPNDRFQNPRRHAGSHVEMRYGKGDNHE